MSVLTKELSMPRLPSVRRPRRPSRGTAKSAVAVTGLEIGATQLVAARARLQDGRIVADRLAVRPLPLGLMRDGLVIDENRLAGELKQFFSQHRLSRRVRVGLSTPRTVLRVIDLPPLEERDINAALMMQAQERIPMPLASAVMDYQTVGLVDTSEGRRLRVIVVATERDGVDRLLAVLRRAGLKPAGIDLSIFAVIRSVGLDRVHGPVLYAQLGDLVNIAIAEGTECRFTRQAPQGLALVLERLAESQGISTEEALALVQRLETTDGPAATDNPEVGDVLQRTAAELGSELRAAAEFYSGQLGSGAVTRGVVAGPLASLPGFVRSLAAASGLELACGEVGASTPEALGGVDARLAPLAAGLAIASVRA